LVVEEAVEEEASKPTEELSTAGKDTEEEAEKTEGKEEISTAGSAAETESLTDAPSGAASQDPLVDLAEVSQTDLAAMVAITSEKIQHIEAQSQLGGSSSSDASPKKETEQKAVEPVAKETSKVEDLGAENEEEANEGTLHMNFSLTPLMPGLTSLFRFWLLSVCRPGSCQC